MLFGHNPNVTVKGMVVHVQTEDRGITNALIDTMVYARGRVLHRRTKSYSDLLPLDADREQALKLRLDDLHATVLEELRSGVLQIPQLAPPAPVVAKPPVRPEPVAPVAAQIRTISVELLNPRTWLAGKHAINQKPTPRTATWEVRARPPGITGPQPPSPAAWDCS